MTHLTPEEIKENFDYYFEVRDELDNVHLVFVMRLAAEKYIEYKPGWRVVKVTNTGKEVS